MLVRLVFQLDRFYRPRRDSHESARYAHASKEVKSTTQASALRLTTSELIAYYYKTNHSANVCLSLAACGRI